MSEVLRTGLELLGAENMFKVGEKCVEFLVDVTWLSKKSAEE